MKHPQQAVCQCVCLANQAIPCRYTCRRPVMHVFTCVFSFLQLRAFVRERAQPQLLLELQRPALLCAFGPRTITSACIVLVRISCSMTALGVSFCQQRLFVTCLRVRVWLARCDERGHEGRGVEWSCACAVPPRQAKSPVDDAVRGSKQCLNETH